MSRASFLMLAVAFSLFATAGECRAQVGFGAQQGLVNSGGSLNVAPVVTNGRRYVRTGISVGLTQVVDVQTFSPVRGFPGLAPINPIGPFGPVGYRIGGAGFSQPRTNNFYNVPAIRKPTASRFVAAAWKLDKDKDARLKRHELEKLALAVVIELKRTPVAYEKLKRGAQGTKKTKMPTEKEVAEAFVQQCLKYDRDKDGALNPHETDVMAAALMRFLG